MTVTTQRTAAPAAPATVARRQGPPDSPREPARPGLYRDRDGDIWARGRRGWVLCLQGGATVDERTVWQWEDGHVRDYAPFALIVAAR